MKYLSPFLFLLLYLFVACKPNNSSEVSFGEGEQLSYNFHIRPILSDKCFACHGPDANKQEAGLRLDLPETAYAALKESPGKYAIIPNDLNGSQLYHRIVSTDPNELMPPPESNLSLTESEIDLIKRWIEQGAQYEPHWAFVSPKKAELPKIKDKEWPRNEIDYFTLAKMNKLGLDPNDQAEKHELLKRVSLDLTGLPPTPEMINAFEKDDSPEAYEKAVDKIMNLPTFGEKMAVLWMDISRYSDSYGYQDDNIRTQWPYRDWVIHAFNKNLPYDQFITWQLAGDMLPNANKEQILATAFNRNHKYTEEGGVIPEEYRVEYVLDKSNTFTKGILGITMECAQCHDHKYDPISQKNFYEMFAFFNNTPEKGYEGDVSQSKPAKTPILWIARDDINELLTFINHQDTSKLMVSVMDELDTLRTTYILNRGLYDARTTPVTPNTPESIFSFPDDLPKNRLGLAQWTVDKNNPLTARVFVNLMWQEIFGVGIVKSTGDFGMQGDLPSHPELLDWLAVDFMENDWDVKRLLKKIMTSATYMQSSKVTKKHLNTDPDNIYLARSPRLRLPAENIRDLVLASSGLLVPEIGGPSVKPYQPEGLWEAATSGRGELKTYKQDKGEKLYRRGLYTFIKLTSPPPMPIIFDGSNRDQCEVNRGRTNTPLQALVMMNDPLVMEASRVLASQLTEKESEPETAIEEAFKRILCRAPNSKELDILSGYFEEELSRFSKDQASADDLFRVGEYPIKEEKIAPNTAAMMQVILAMYNLEEAITKI
ncbi:PSD1 and planctomycete cytochrome C domain-containing protein [Aquiflexum gelatinilyticum]|uniref:PSD1 and planctomycete cytochrome C domain-containing protein n=1 Tax=Aquiflexum gelatinilyticum TaxID=2961943 RepID=UPI0021695E32|nr:PSD1 and planctomycete cytochrome C domain-containing protein [Aquiflexum gelatinilyticum]MCS4433087.1 PSD1 and planctomycete cytochrome C domain-containing protein [Aquiflexum gelatinilyticum]